MYFILQADDVFIVHMIGLKLFGVILLQRSVIVTLLLKYI